MKEPGRIKQFKYLLTLLNGPVTIPVMVVNNNTNPLEDLLIDSDTTVGPDVLLELLKPYTRINKKTGKVILTPNGMKESSKIKVLLYLLTRKAMRSLGLVGTEMASPKEIRNNYKQEIPENTVYISVKRLTDAGLIRNENSKYYIPDFNLHKVERILGEKNDE